MIDFKKFLISIMILCSANIAFAESCIMISDAEIKDIQCVDKSIINVRVLTTLTNEKRSIIITSLKDGCTEFSVKIKNKCHDYKVKVVNGKLEIKGNNNLKILPIDLPPEALPNAAKEECNN